jgi:hypothetical protein
MNIQNASTGEPGTGRSVEAAEWRIDLTEAGTQRVRGASAKR